MTSALGREQWGTSISRSVERPPMVHSVVTWTPERIAGALGIAQELGLDAYPGKVDENWPHPTLVVFPPTKGDLGEFWKRLEAEYPRNPQV